MPASFPLRLALVESRTTPRMTMIWSLEHAYQWGTMAPAAPRVLWVAEPLADHDHQSGLALTAAALQQAIPFAPLWMVRPRAAHIGTAAAAHRTRVDSALATTVQRERPKVIIIANPLTIWGDEPEAWLKRLTDWRSTLADHGTIVVLVQHVPRFADAACLRALDTLRATVDERWQLTQSDADLFLHALNERATADTQLAELAALALSSAPTDSDTPASGVVVH